MIKLNLQIFGGRGGSGGTGAGAGGGGTKQDNTGGSAGGSGKGSSGGSGKGKSTGAKQPVQFTDNEGNVKVILSGYKYDLYSVEKNKEAIFNKGEPWKAEDTRDYLEGYEYDSKTGTFVDKNTGMKYRVKVHKKKK